MTIGIGFECVDGVVLCADNQITFYQSHKYYERKIYHHQGDGWAAAFTYSGNPNLMKAFNDKFPVLANELPAAIDVQKLRNVIEGLLLPMDATDFGDGFNMLCGITAADKSALLKTDNRTVRGLNADRFYSYIGCGDSSVLQYLGPLLTRTESHDCTVDQAFGIGVYLIAQAKRHIDGCGGDTDAIILKEKGKIEYREPSTIYNAEQHLLLLEHFIGKVSAAFFDPRITEDEFDEILGAVCKRLKTEREPHAW